MCFELYIQDIQYDLCKGVFFFYLKFKNKTTLNLPGSNGCICHEKRQNLLLTRDFKSTLQGSPVENSLQFKYRIMCILVLNVQSKKTLQLFFLSLFLSLSECV